MIVILLYVQFSGENNQIIGLDFFKKVLLDAWDLLRPKSLLYEQLQALSIDQFVETLQKTTEELFN